MTSESPWANDLAACLKSATAGDAIARMLLHHRVEQFYFLEAARLDARDYRGWFALLADDLTYRMPLRFNRTARERSHEFSRPGESFLFDEDKASIDRRIKRLETGMAWAEEPPSRTRHAISNVRVHPSGLSANADDPIGGNPSGTNGGLEPAGAADAQSSGDTVVVTSYFHVYRSRLERQVDQLVGERTDRLRIVTGETGFEVVERYAVLDQATVLANNLSMFF